MATRISREGSMIARSGPCSLARMADLDLRRSRPAHLGHGVHQSLEVPGGTGYLRSGDVLALFLERGHSRMRSAKLLGTLEGPRRRQRREVRLKVGGHAEDGVHPGRLVVEPLPVG
jgi:hypothetical protein